MNLYLISQKENNNYDTHDSAVVCAATEEEARLWIPWEGRTPPESSVWKSRHSTWCSSPDEVSVKLVGVADPSRDAGFVVCSFNAG